MRKVLQSLWYIITVPFRLVRWILRKIVNFFRSIVANIRNFFSYEEEDTPLPDAFAKTIQHPQEILVHVDILRKHLLRAVLVLVCTTALSFAFIRQIMEFLSYPLPGGLPGLIAIEVTENIGTVMRVSLLSGFAMALPYIIIEIYLFVAPGLSPKTRIKGILAIPVAFLLFLAERHCPIVNMLIF